mmetsp:Transcript_16765/g.37822  ORF Transcript_16765/g.37822 Transcript_16765/m.37822 type:complete len:796 (-) Transcript_16765:62-2449(-)
MLGRLCLVRQLDPGAWFRCKASYVRGVIVGIFSLSVLVTYTFSTTFEVEYRLSLRQRRVVLAGTEHDRYVSAGDSGLLTIVDRGGNFGGTSMLAKSLLQGLGERDLRAIGFDERCAVHLHGETRTPVNNGPARVLLVVNAEDYSGEEVWRDMRKFSMLPPRDHVLILGNWWNETHMNFSDAAVSSLWIPFASLNFAERKNSTPLDLLGRSTSAPVPRQKSVVYMQSACLGLREPFWDALNLGLTKEHIGVAAGRCNGHLGLGKRATFPRAPIRYDGDVAYYQGFKFAVTMEHSTNSIGYVTEKIINALLAGTVPVYHGAAQADAVVSPKRFLWVKSAHWNETIQTIVSALNDPAKYAALMDQMIGPAVSERSMKRFFSWHPAVWPEYGDQLRRDILGLLAKKCTALRKRERFSWTAPASAHHPPYRERFRQQIHGDLAAWQSASLNASDFAELTRKKRAAEVVVLRLTSQAVSVVSGRYPVDTAWSLLGRYAFGAPHPHSEVVRVIMKHFQNGVPQIPRGKFVYMALNGNDRPITEPSDKQRCRSHLFQMHGAEAASKIWGSPGAPPTEALRVPVLSHAKIPFCSRDLLMPWPDLFVPLSSLWTSRTFSASSSFRRFVAWPEKSNGLIWRGQSSLVRQMVIEWASRRQDVDVKAATSGAQRMTMQDQSRYRVILDMDGASYSKRLVWLLGKSSSAVLRTGVFSDVLLNQATAGKDYAYFNLSEASFNQAVDDLLHNDSYAQSIAVQGSRFGEQFLKPELWVEYVVMLVEAYCGYFRFHGDDVPKDAWWPTTASKP